MPLGCKFNISSWMQFNIRFAISLNSGHLQKEFNKEKVWAVAKQLQETATCIFNSPCVSVHDWQQLKLFVYQQNNCQPCDQLSGERLAQEI